MNIVNMGENSSLKRKIIIDTDPGHDDAMAIMLALKSRMFEVLAITTVAGNSTIENTTRNARCIMQLLASDGLEDAGKIPVYSGSSKPLDRDLVQAVVHGVSGLEGIDPTNEPGLTYDAVDRLINIVEENDSVTLVTLGPLTNIARAIQKNPEVMTRLDQIIMMGGAVKVPGNKNRVAEFNFFVDPEAADIVISFPVRKVVVPLDACNKVQMQISDFQKIRNERIRDFVLRMVKPYIKNIEMDDGISAALMYDPLTVFHLIKPEACSVKEYNIRVETSGRLTRGMSVADLRLKPECGPNVLVVEEIDAESFKSCFIDVLGR